MSETTTSPAGTDPELTPKQRRILGYLRTRAGRQTYFKSRLIAEDLGLSVKEVGTNIARLREADTAVTIEQWGFSSGTTWKVTL
ncbi:hypothetical protein BRC83_09475 [Halobacteriales archaeon QS_1_68_17]|nr:MAG: hypothetical protein BRC83_09475 [Halobacteriales archaeon QS_1_68_17]